MHWRVEVTLQENFPDPVGHDAQADLTAAGIMAITQVRTARIYELSGDLSRDEVERITTEILCDPVVETARVLAQDDATVEDPAGVCTIEVRRKPGVMDPVEGSARKAIEDLGLHADSVTTATRYRIESPTDHAAIETAARKVLANEIVDAVDVGGKHRSGQGAQTDYRFARVTVEMLGLKADGLATINQQMRLSLLPVEMKAIQDYFISENRNPTDVELQTIAQTWSEHCKHKTLMGPVQFGDEKFDNLLGETIKAATETLDKPWCVSVFKDNAGIIEFDDTHNVCFKVETHNHPSAIEPYGGANTGMGGVIRDPLGTGLGAKPILNTDIFCFGPPETEPAELPAGTLHPRQIMKGVVSGVRDYGNRMGIPTVNGSVFFDKRYIGNPLVYCGNVGLIPTDQCEKETQPGDWIVAVGGRTGRDGIQGATFSSATLNDQSEVTSGSAVQIGNAITEKTVVDTILQARDERLYSSITDCGAGGFSSAVGEMGEHTGADVQLDKAPLKYTGLTYTEIWISESQERMVLSVPPDKLDRTLELFAAEDVEATVIGRFTNTQRLVLSYEGNEVLNMAMAFLHDGLPKTVRQATWTPPTKSTSPLPAPRDTYTDNLHAILGSGNVCSKEWIIRQYDHEVQAGSIIKPLVGVANDGPGDAAVCAPIPGSDRGIVLSNGMNPLYGDWDPYAMAASAIDEALRNIVAVGGSIEQCAILDNFCWGDGNKPDRLGSMVLASKACHDIAIAYGTPFISGKDSLNNEFVTDDGQTIVIPPSLLISAIAIMPDVTKAISMDAKAVGNRIYVLGVTQDELGGSHFNLVTNRTGGTVPQVDTDLGNAVFAALAAATDRRLVRSAHDCSEGGLAVSLAEMAFAGGLGIAADLTDEATHPAVALFSESNSRLIVEVEPKQQANFEAALGQTPHRLIGTVTDDPTLKITHNNATVIDAPITALKATWQAESLRWH